MLVALFCAVVGCVVLIIFLLHPYISVGFWLLYIVTYFNAPERTGRWSQDWVRSWSVWRRVSSCVMQNQKLLEEPPANQKLLFLVAPNVTLIPMFWNFGLHGQALLRDLDVVFTVPRVLLMIPLLRDILLMAGAVEDDFDTVKRLLQKGRSVCMCPSGLQGYLFQQTPEHSIVRGISAELAQQCIESEVHVVPVVFSGETARYEVIRDDKLLAWQARCYRQCGYPFPLCFRLNPRVKVTTMISAPISPRPYGSNYHDFVTAIHTNWSGLGTTPEHLMTIQAPPSSATTVSVI